MDFFENCDVLKQIIINGKEIYSNGYLNLNGSNIVSIDNSPFQSMPMTDAYIPASVTQLHPKSFALCTKLVNLMIDLSAENFFPLELYQIRALTNYTINSIPIIQNRILDLSNLNITSIEEMAFSSLTLIEAKLANISQNFEKRVFADCQNLKRVIIPYPIQRISQEMFYNCYNLATIVINDSLFLDQNVLDLSKSSVVNVDSAAFASVSILKVIFGKESVTMQDGIFGQNSVLTNVEFLEIPTELNINSSFSSCPNLFCVSFPSENSCQLFPQLSFSDFVKNSINLQNKDQWCEISCSVIKSGSESEDESSDDNDIIDDESSIGYTFLYIIVALIGVGAVIGFIWFCMHQKRDYEALLGEEA